MKIASALIAALMFASLMPLPAFAQGQGQQQPCATCGGPITGNAVQAYNEQQTQAQNGSGNGSIEQIQQNVMNQNRFQNTFEEEKEQFQQAKQQYRSRTMDENQFKVHVQNYLGKSVDKIESLALKIRDRLHDRDMDAMLNHTRLRLLNATTKDDLVSIAKDLKNAWNQYRIRAKYRINQDASDKLTGIINNANGLAVRLNASIAQLNKQGADTGNMTQMLNQFQEKVRLAYEYKERARLMLGNYSEDANREQVMNEVHVQLRNSQDALKEAHQLLKAIAIQLREKHAEMNRAAQPTQESVDNTTEQ